MFLSKLTAAAVVFLTLCAGGLVASHFLATRPSISARASPPAVVQQRTAASGPRRDGLGDELPPGVPSVSVRSDSATRTRCDVCDYSPDGKQLVSASWDGTARLWEAASGKELARFPIPGGGSGAAVSPDWHARRDRRHETVRYLLGREDRKELGRSGKLEDTIFFIQFSPDSRMVAAASGDALRLYDTVVRKELHKFAIARGGAHCLRFTPDGNALTAACADGTIRFWNVMTGKESLCLKGHTQSARVFHIASDGKSLISVGGA